MKKAILCLVILSLGSTLAFGREPKESDSDVIYGKGRIPHYDLPPLLVTAEGERVTTAQQWRNIRRPQILSVFSNFVYGRVPEPESPIETESEVKETAPELMQSFMSLARIPMALTGARAEESRQQFGRPALLPGSVIPP